MNKNRLLSDSDKSNDVTCDSFHRWSIENRGNERISYESLWTRDTSPKLSAIKLHDNHFFHKDLLLNYKQNIHVAV